MRPFGTLLLAAVLATGPSGAAAFETDQYNLPPSELADIAVEIDTHVYDGLAAVAAKLNEEIARHEACLATAEGRDKCGSETDERKAVAFLLSSESIEKAVYEELGAGDLFVTKFGRWIRSHKFNGSPSSYSSPYLESIFIANPIDHVTISPTVKLYGVELGTDKLEHLFQQGYKYASIRREGLKKNMSVPDAELKAIAWGQKTERTYFGTLVSGVYSNADLFANFAGMRFYENLTRTLFVDGKGVEPVFAIRAGRWAVQTERGRGSLAPFITEHMNEAFNPSSYSFTIFWSVKRSVRRNACPEWKTRMPDAKKADLEMRSASLRTWNGANYGFTRPKRSISIGDLCF